MKSVKKPFIISKGAHPDSRVTSKLEKFLKTFQTFEQKNSVDLLILLDKRSTAFYLNCHLDSEILAWKTDLDAVLDPNESEDYKLNREIYTDTHAYQLMESDAVKGRSFEDLVLEYDTSYRPDRPLKVFGGQHRIMAIKEAIQKGVSVMHGCRVYFGLSVEQKINIAVANNTSIAISNDLLDRMQEEVLGADLRNWSQMVGLLREGQNFADKRSPEGIPTVRVVRTLLVNFFKGKDTKEGDFHIPVVCKSGPGVDGDYMKLRAQVNWQESDLLKMGREFSRLHKLQRERVLGRNTDKYVEFANKTMHPCIVASWAYTAGFLQQHAGSLNNHYVLADTKSPGDPLNAKALLNARLKGVDPDTYRGLGARINAVEIGRMLEVFLLQATKAKQRGIKQKLANAAIKSYEAKRAKRDAEKALKGL